MRYSSLITPHRLRGGVVDHVDDVGWRKIDVAAAVHDGRTVDGQVSPGETLKRALFLTVWNQGRKIFSETQRVCWAPTLKKIWVVV